MCTARGIEPLPPSLSQGVRSPFVLHNPRPFHRAVGPLSGPLHLRRSKLPRWPLDSDAQTTPFLSISPPRIPNAGAGTLNTSESPVAGSNRRNPGGPPKMPTVYQIEPSTGDGITA